MAILSSPLQYLIATPPVTKLYVFLLISLSSLHFYLKFASKDPTPYLTLIPGLSIWFPWSLISAAFVETTILELIFSLFFLTPGLRYFERLWGTRETIKFMLIVITIPNIIAFFMNWLEYIVTGYSELFLYNQEYHGQMSLQTAILVAFTQLIPEHQVQLFGSLKIRVKRFPMAYVTFSTVICLLGFQSPFVLIQFGWLVSWTYLRFYKRTTLDNSAGEEIYGDRSDTFAFIYWFPPFVRYPVGLLSSAVYNIALRLKLVVPSGAVPSDLESGYASVPGGTRAEAERRRALALKALDQRLATNANPAPGPSNPSVSTDETTRVPAKPSRPQPAVVATNPSNPLPAVDTDNKDKTSTEVS